MIYGLVDISINNQIVELLLGRFTTSDDAKNIHELDKLIFCQSDWQYELDWKQTWRLAYPISYDSI